jgi:hypothetical protein
MRPGQGIVIEPLDGSAKLVTVTQAEDGYVYVTAIDGDESNSRVVRIMLTDDDALDLAAALRKATRR